MRFICSILNEAQGATVAALGPSKEVEEQESGEGEDNIHKVRDVNDLLCSTGHGPSALKRLKALCPSVVLPVPTAVLEATVH